MANITDMIEEMIPVNDEELLDMYLQQQSIYDDFEDFVEEGYVTEIEVIKETNDDITYKVTTYYTNHPTKGYQDEWTIVKNEDTEEVLQYLIRRYHTSNMY